MGRGRLFSQAVQSTALASSYRPIVPRRMSLPSSHLHTSAPSPASIGGGAGLQRCSAIAANRRSWSGRTYAQLLGGLRAGQVECGLNLLLGDGGGEAPPAYPPRGQRHGGVTNGVMVMMVAGEAGAAADWAWGRSVGFDCTLGSVTSGLMPPPSARPLK